MSKILVVDDEEAVLRTMRRMLESEGHEVIAADDGRKCLEILESEKPDLILMDVMMPGLDGWDAVKELKKDESNKDIAISMLTVKSKDIDRIKSLDEVDAEWHIAKPIRREKLLETVDWLLTNPPKY